MATPDGKKPKEEEDSFSKASGVYVGVCPVHNHRVYRFSQACKYLMKKSI